MPARPISNDTEEENKTPKTFAGLNPKTPVTVTAPMQMAVTPAVANKVIATPATLFQEKAGLPALPGDIEYSFEERRLAVYLARQVA
jgi:F-type H+-transporting ATPase subunit beta/protein regulator of cytokinesis 1